ncbi:hypothetical protein [Mycobacterium sp. NS-7484]|uniref:hypothetical protein n=1 Tax=Mycobacterium sp. NS-7484 TaxID=1834161 RepID=UPI001151CC23|nr:hypothetical protein [Mycobacterium sp. NS-7484]
MPTIGKILAIGVPTGIASAIIWLFGGTFWGGIILGALAGLILSWSVPIAVNYLRGRSMLSAVDKRTVLGLSSVGAIALVLALVIGLFLRAYDPEIEALNNVSLGGDSDRSVMYGVEWDGERYIAVGYRQPGTTGNTAVSGAVWQSPDGFTWKPFRDDVQMFGSKSLPDGTSSEVLMSAVRRTDNGLLIVGRDSSDGGKSRGSVWRVRNGKDGLERADELNFPAEATHFTAYEHHDEDEIVVGGNRDNAIAWFRHGGKDWTSTSLGPLNEVGTASVRYIDGTWLICGYDRQTDPAFEKSDVKNANSEDGAIWSSNDGIRWEKSTGFAGQPEAQKVQDIVFARGLWLAFGLDSFADSPRMDAAIWTSENGKDWSKEHNRVIDGVNGWQAMNGAVVVDEKVTVVGSKSIGNDTLPVPVPSTPSGSSMTTAAWEVTFKGRNGSRNPWNALIQLFA